ncbi:MAG TPA: FHA domain-containing protein [Steroidobacteraceae bacterium]|nr:FHA domain-containing protein [Steroidobacteraceae bacterium]
MAKERSHTPKDHSRAAKEHSGAASEHSSAANEHSHAPNDLGHTADSDLDRTDQLPILAGVTFDQDVEDDAVRMDFSTRLDNTARMERAGSPGPVSSAAGAGMAADFVRPSPVDLPSLAESVRSVEERIARQHAEYEALTRAYERARDAESAAVARANALAADLAAARTALEARDATIVQVLHSLSERDAQLSAMQAEHAKIVPELEAKSRSTAQLDADLHAARGQVTALTTELQTSRQATADLAARLKHGESEVNAARSEVGAAKTQAGSYLELLRTREWRRGFDLNLFRELDAQVGAAHMGTSALESERDRLQGKVAALEARLAAQTAAADTERARVAAELAASDRAIAEERDRGSGNARRVAELQEAAQLREAEHATQVAQLRSEQTGQIARLEAEAETHEQELTVLMAHLQEARRPIQSIEADVKRLTDELAAKSAAADGLAEENRQLQAMVERTKGALEEREFLIRRLERSETNNANVLGRIQTSIERLGSPAGPAADWSAELIRIDGEQPVTHVLSRRTRIGRAPGCELQIDSTSVSRHHALVVVGPRDVFIEDLNSTNGVLVNGRKVTRQQLNDGDAVTIGDIHFRYFARPMTGLPEPKPAEPSPAT